MSFEIIARDMAGKIGRLQTKSGVLETPYMFPVVHPQKQLIPPKQILKDLKFNGIITNAYLLWQSQKLEALEKGIHNILDFNGIVMTDSGAYQILIYGEETVEITQSEIIKFQEDIGSDIAVILDVPTGGKPDRSNAEYTVDITLRRAKEAVKLRKKTKRAPLWTGPIQGGIYSDLVIKSTKGIANLGYDIFAIGSPTQLLEQYQYDLLVDLVMAAKSHLPLEKPVHLFGAGHPMIFPLAVALGCDLFDSAAYALYARAGRYITPTGTRRLEDISDQICNCPVCSKYPPYTMKNLEPTLKEEVLAQHNLHACMLELSTIKQAIREGRLWEYVQIKAKSHPQLLKATMLLEEYTPFLEEQTPVTKQRGLFFTGPLDFHRPEVYRYHKKLMNYPIPDNADILVILPIPKNGKSGYSFYHKQILEKIQGLGSISERYHLCVLSIPFGIIPLELSQIYPLTQHESTNEITAFTQLRLSETILEYLNSHNYRAVVLYTDWTIREIFPRKLRKFCTNNHLLFHLLPGNDIPAYSKQGIEKLMMKLKSQLGGE